MHGVLRKALGKRRQGLPMAAEAVASAQAAVEARRTHLHDTVVLPQLEQRLQQVSHTWRRCLAQHARTEIVPCKH